MATIDELAEQVAALESRLGEQARLSGERIAAKERELEELKNELKEKEERARAEAYRIKFASLSPNEQAIEAAKSSIEEVNRLKKELEQQRAATEERARIAELVKEAEKNGWDTTKIHNASTEREAIIAFRAAREDAKDREMAALKEEIQNLKSTKVSEVVSKVRGDRSVPTNVTSTATKGSSEEQVLLGEIEEAKKLRQFQRLAALQQELRELRS